MLKYSIKKLFSRIPLLLLLAVLMISVLLASCNTDQSRFEFFAGDESVIVLLREDDLGTYQVRYIGSQPAQIRNIQTMIAGEILHVDVEQVRVVTENHDIVLVDNNVPEGQALQVNPQDVLEMQVTFSGQSIGYNYLHGFRINFDVEGENLTEDVVDPEVPDGYQYLVAVE